MIIHNSGSRNKRIGNWCWALSAEEGLTVVLVQSAQRDRTPLGRNLQRRYEAMLVKQRKLLARAKSGGTALSARGGAPADGYDAADDFA